MMRGDYAVAGLTFRPGEMKTAVKDWATADTGATVIGIAGGVFLGEWLGSWVVNQFNIQEGWNNLIAKAVTKAGLSFVFFFIARKVTPGIGRILLNGMAAGPLVSIIGDIAGGIVAPALGFIPGSSSNLTIKPKTQKNVGNIGGNTSVITTV